MTNEQRIKKEVIKEQVHALIKTYNDIMDRIEHLAEYLIIMEKLIEHDPIYRIPADIFKFAEILKIEGHVLLNLIKENNREIQKKVGNH